MEDKPLYQENPKIGKKEYNFYAIIGETTYGDFEASIKAEDIFKATISAFEKYQEHKSKDPQWKKSHGSDISIRVWRI